MLLEINLKGKVCKANLKVRFLNIKIFWEAEGGSDNL